MDPVSTIQLVASTAALSKNISQWASEWVSESHRSLVRRVHGISSRESVYGLDVVNASEDDREHDVDICFVHGLTGDRRLTWKLDGDSDSGFWPKELLAHDARIGRARVFTYGYDSDFPSFEYLTERTLYHQAQELLNELSHVRQKDGRRRLIFVCHTLGGILVQSALVIALASKDEALKRIQRSVRGLIFLNTPYSGKLTDEEWSRVFKHLVHVANPDMQESRFSSKKLKIMLEPFAVASSDIQIKELTASKTGVSIRLRDHEISGSLQADSFLDSDVFNALGHVSGKQDPNYELLVQEIASICRKSRFAPVRERKQNFLPQAGARFFALDRDLPCRTDSRMDLAAQVDGLFGRWTEISSRHGLVVCLNGPAGAGKTQLALAYAHKKAEDFTSVFWIAAENTQSIELGFYGIGNRLLKHYSSILSEGWNLPEQSATLTAAEMLGLREVVQDPDFSIRPPTSQVSRIVTEAVRDWFNRADNTNWLLILDSMDAPDLNECLSLLPTQRQNGLILITRRETWSPPPAMRARAVVKHISPVQNVKPCATYASLERFKDNGTAPAQKQGFGIRLNDLSETEHKLLACCSFFPGEFIPIRFFSVNCQTLHILDDKYTAGNVNDAIRDVFSGLDGFVTVRDDLEDVIAEESRVSIWRNKLDPGVLKTVQTMVWPCMLSFASNLSKTRSPMSVAVTSLNQKRLVDMINSYSNKQGAAPLQTLSTYDYLKLATLCLHRGYRDTAETVTDYARQRLSKPELHTEVSVRLLDMYIELKRTTKAEALFKRMHANTPRAANFKTSFQKLEARMSELSGKVDETVSLLRNIMMKQDQLGKNDSSRDAHMWALEDLVSFLIRKHNYEIAEPLLRRQLLTSEREYGSISPAVISTLEKLVSVYLGQGRLEDAEDALLRVHQSNAARLGVDHPKTQACALELAGIHGQRGNHEKALELYTCALELYEKWHGPAAPESLTVRMRRAECFEARQMLEEASSDYSAALEACEKAAGIEHKSYSESIDELKGMLMRYLPTLEDSIKV